MKHFQLSLDAQLQLFRQLQNPECTNEKSDGVDKELGTREKEHRGCLVGELETTSLLELGWLFTFSYRQMGYRVSSNTDW